MQVHQAVSQANELGKARLPFFILVDFEMNKIKIRPLDELKEDILFDINGINNYAAFHNKANLEFKVTPYPFDKYYHEFQKVLEEINYGNTFLINLTAKHQIETKASLLDIFHASQAKYKLYIKDKFVVFSPESFVRIIDGFISSFPMKGTMDASIPNAKTLLLSDQKEKAEHHTIVDLIRNDLSIYAKKVRVEKFRFLDYIKSNKKDLYQMSSEIKGKLPDDYHSQLGDILFSMLPAGSISGAPKKKTVEIIQAAEKEPRGYYTGICGIYDGVNFDSCVLIRYIEKEGNKLYYRSGGGITFQSEVEKEYQEMIDKVYLPIG